MLSKTSVRIFLFFTGFLLSLSAILALLFGKLVVDYQQTALFDSLLAEIQITAKSAELSKESIVLADGSIRGELSNSIDPKSLKGSLPPSGATVFSCSDLKGRTNFCSVAKLATPEWVIRMTPKPRLLNVLGVLAKELAGSFVLLLLLMMAIAFLSSRALVNPLKKLVVATNKISSGDYENLDLPENRNDEVGELARAFKLMISEIERREKYLKDAGLKIAHAARLATIGQMGASIAHEVKNPLMALHGHARILQQKITDRELAEVAQILVAESDRCNQILQQMLRYSRNDSHQRRPYAIMDVVRSSVQLVQAEAKKKRVELQISSTCEEVLNGSAQQVQQVFLNILLNAIQATKENSSVIIDVFTQDSRLKIRVKDQGTGIPQEIQSKIFDPFFTTKDKKEGSGLGLSIAATLIAEEEGHISFESSSSGTTFEISLPLPLAKTA